MTFDFNPLSNLESSESSLVQPLESNMQDLSRSLWAQVEKLSNSLGAGSQPDYLDMDTSSLYGTCDEVAGENQRDVNSLQMFEMQQYAQQLNQAEQVAGNLSKSSHDTVMQVIQNLR